VLRVIEIMRGSAPSPFERRDHQWYAQVREVPETAFSRPTQEAAVAGAMRRLAEKTERRELALDMLHRRDAAVWAQELHGTDFLALW
jgi:hypothetical protein